jgi:hypothetical protein
MLAAATVAALALSLAHGLGPGVDRHGDGTGAAGTVEEGAGVFVACSHVLSPRRKSRMAKLLERRPDR